MCTAFPAGADFRLLVDTRFGLVRCPRQLPDVVSRAVPGIGVSVVGKPPAQPAVQPPPALSRDSAGLEGRQTLRTLEPTTRGPALTVGTQSSPAGRTNMPGPAPPAVRKPRAYTPHARPGCVPETPPASTFFYALCAGMTARRQCKALPPSCRRCLYLAATLHVVTHLFTKAVISRRRALPVIYRQRTGQESAAKVELCSCQPAHW